MPRTKYNPETDTRSDFEKVIDNHSAARKNVARLRERLEAAEQAVKDAETAMDEYFNSKRNGSQSEA